VRIPPHKPQMHIALSVPMEQTIQASARPSVPLWEGGSQLTRCRPRASLDWTPGSAIALEHDGVHSRADALSPVLIKAVRDTPRR